MKKYLLLVPVMALSACSYITREESNQRMDRIEEKVDSIIVHNNTTYDILVDNELRLSELEKDARKRGVPVPQKNISVQALQQVPANQAGYQENLPQINAQQVQPAPVGAITGQDLSKVQEVNQNNVTQNVVQPAQQPVQTQPVQQVQQVQQPVQTQPVQQVQQAQQPVQKAQAQPAVQPKPVQQKTAPKAQAQQAQPKQQASKQQPVQTQPAQPKQQVQQVQQPVQTAQAAPVGQQKALSSQALYEQAFQYYVGKEYAKAEQAFNEFLAKYPHDILAPNALYWKGETLYARAIYPQAIFAFKEVQTRYPKHPKTADSLLKTAMSYARLGDKENASLHYLVLLEDWPNSEAAQKARAMGAM